MERRERICERSWVSLAWTRSFQAGSPPVASRSAISSRLNPPRSLAEDDYRQPLYGARLVLASQSGSLDASDEPVALVVVQGRGGEPGSGPDLADVDQVAH